MYLIYSKFFSNVIECIPLISENQKRMMILYLLYNIINKSAHCYTQFVHKVVHSFQSFCGLSEYVANEFGQGVFSTKKVLLFMTRILLFYRMNIVFKQEIVGFELFLYFELQFSRLSQYHFNQFQNFQNFLKRYKFNIAEDIRCLSIYTAA